MINKISDKLHSGNKKTIISVLAVFLISIFFLLIIIRVDSFLLSSTNYCVKDGTANLTDEDLSNSCIDLTGYWKFYPNQFLTINQIKDETQYKPTFIKVPGFWNNSAPQLKDGRGFATYYLKIILGKKYKSLSFYIKPIYSSYSLYINGKEVWDVGVIGTDKNSYKPKYNTNIITFEPTTQELDIIFYVSNYDNIKGGLLSKIIIGSNQSIINTYMINIAIDFLTIGLLIFMGIFSLNYYIKRKKETSFLYFALCLLMIITRSFFVNTEYLNYFFSGLLNWETSRKIEYITTVLTFLFISEFFKHFLKTKPVILATAFNFVSSLAIMFVISLTPVYTSIQVYSIFTSVIIIYILLMLFELARLTSKNSKDSKYILPGSIALGVCALYDLLGHLAIINTNTSLFTTGSAILVFNITIVLVHRINKSLVQAQNISKKYLKLNKIKDDFFINTSFEIKAPLKTIISLAEDLLSSQENKFTEKQRYEISLITASAAKLTYLINDIIDITLIKNHEIQLIKQPVNIRLLSDVVITMITAHSSKLKIKIENNIPHDLPLVLADDERLQQIFFNIIARTFSNHQTLEIILDAEVCDNMIETKIKCSSDEQITIINNTNPNFDDNSAISDLYNSYGLGLLKKLIELHEGSLKIISNDKNTFSFSFNLPIYINNNLSTNPSLNEERTIAIKSSDIISQNIKNELKKNSKNQKENAHSNSCKNVVYLEDIQKNILIVNDEPITRFLLTQFLASEGHNIYLAEGAEHALFIFQNNNIDLVIIDIALPKMIGIELCKTIRKNYNLFNTPILILANKGDENIKLAINEGANDFIFKPIDKIEILTRVKTLISLKQFIEDSVENAKKLEAEWYNRIIAEKLNDMSKQITSTKDIEEIIKYIIQTYKELIDFSKSLVILNNENKPYVIWNQGITDPEFEKGKNITISNNNLIKKVFESSEMLIIADISNTDLSPIGSGISYLCIPLINVKQYLGIIILISNIPNHFDNEYFKEVINQSILQICIAIENALLFHKTLELATRDGLTGLYNRRYFFEISENYFKRSKRYNYPFSIIMMDIDHFKNINDTYGHYTGDEIIKSVAENASRCLRESDIIGRYGGEEFIILLLEAKIDEAAIIAERIRKTLEEFEYLHKETNVKLKITASFGVSEFMHDYNSIMDIIKIADERLYIAKETGRNKVISNSDINLTKHQV